MRLSVVVFLGAWIVSNFPKPFGILAVVPSSPLRCVSRWQDIVIGAPQYFDRDGEVGGAVYVYINQQGKWSNVKPIRLNGTKDSMFGISVKNIGDINQDGYPDIAVGAPYDDLGKVFIYHGSPTGIITKPTQVLEGTSPYFGYSIAGNMDLDRNSYPDLAVGSLSDSVTIFRSRPVINILKTITVTPNRIDLRQKSMCGSPSGICLKVKACFEYTAKPSGYNPPISILGILEAEKERRKSGLSSRVQFRNQGSEPKYTQELTLNRQKQRACMEETLWLQENIRDKLRPIPITASVEIQEPSSRRRVNSLPEVLPILNSNEAKTVQTDVSCLASLLPVLDFFFYRPLPVATYGDLVYAFNPSTRRQGQEISEFTVSVISTANSSSIRVPDPV